MLAFLKTTIYTPLYNGLIFLVDTLPWVDAGVAVVLFTLIVKFVLFPLSKKAVITQLKVKKIDPEIKKIKEEYKEDKQEQARQLLDLYKKEGINPFSGIILIFIQIPIVFSLYFMFSNGFPVVDTNILYSFVPEPGNINPIFLGFIDISEKSYILALTAGISSFFQIRYSLPKVEKKALEERTFKDDLAHSMNVQMRFGMPVIILFTAFFVGGAVALYWTTSNLFMLGQELYLRKKVRPNYNEE